MSSLRPCFGFVMSLYFDCVMSLFYEPILRTCSAFDWSTAVHCCNISTSRLTCCNVKFSQMLHKFCIHTVIRRRWSNYMWHVCFDSILFSAGRMARSLSREFGNLLREPASRVRPITGSHPEPGLLASPGPTGRSWDLLGVHSVHTWHQEEEEETRSRRRRKKMRSRGHSRCRAWDRFLRTCVAGSVSVGGGIGENIWPTRMEKQNKSGFCFEQYSKHGMGLQRV